MRAAALTLVAFAFAILSGPAPVSGQPFAYVASTSTVPATGTLSVIDTKTDAVVASVAIGKNPGDVVVHPDGSSVYVPDGTNGFLPTSTNMVQVIDAAAHAVVATVPIQGSPVALAAHPERNRLYVGTFTIDLSSLPLRTQGGLVVIDTATNAVLGSIPLSGGAGQAIAVDPAGFRVYVSQGGNSIAVIDTETNALIASVPIVALGMAVHPVGTVLYATNLGGVSLIDTNTHAIVGNIPLGFAGGIAVHPDGKRIYVKHQLPQTPSTFAVAIIDTATRAVIHSVTLPGAPSGIDVRADGHRLYVAACGVDSINRCDSTKDGTVSVIDTATNVIIKTVLLGRQPRAGDGKFIGPVRRCPDGPGGDELPKVEQIIWTERCGVPGLIRPRWGRFTAPDGSGLAVLEAASGEKLELRCVDGGRPDRNFYGLFYTAPGRTSTDPLDGLVGRCPFHEGCNDAWFSYAGIKEGKPACFVATFWRSKDYGPNDRVNRWTGELQDVGKEEPRPVLDWVLARFDARNDRLSFLNYKFLYRGDGGFPPVDPAAMICDGLFPLPPEGDLLQIRSADPPLGPETRAFFAGIAEDLEAGPPATGPTTPSSLRICDLNQDGRCDSTDRDLLQASLGKCRGEEGYNPAADIDANGCVTSSDQEKLFGLNAPPVAVCRNVTVSTAPHACHASISVDGGSFDPDGDAIVRTQSPAGPYPLGSTDVMLTVADDKGATDSCKAKVIVVDQESPVIASVSAAPAVLWPPNHKMIPVNVSAAVSDNCDSQVVCSITAVTSNEAVDGLGDGDTSPDWMTRGPLAVDLRAERSGIGTGRIYTVGITCRDASGKSSAGTATVAVPRDRP